ncbi:hypothetical protein GCM10025734_14380 [Kitasatospora paranensis]
MLERMDLFQQAPIRWRIDHPIATPGLAARCIDASVERAASHGERWSEHAPVMAMFDIGQLR